MAEILAPIQNVKEVTPLRQAGADAVFCGVVTHEWQRRYSAVGNPNREKHRLSNLYDHMELAELVSASHEQGLKAYFTLNMFYSEDQYGLLEKETALAVEAGVDSLIVCDLGLMLLIKEWGLDVPVHFSSAGGVLNAPCADFYRHLGASRIVLPPQFELSEIGRLVGAVDDMEFEIQVMNGICKNVESMCHFRDGINQTGMQKKWNLMKTLHLEYHVKRALKRMPEAAVRALESTSLYSSMQPSPCCKAYDVTVLDKAGNELPITPDPRVFAPNSSFQQHGCGACHIMDLLDFGVHTLKIVGRGARTAKKVMDVRLTRRAVELAEIHRGDRETYHREVKKSYRRIHRLPCRNYCYFA